MFLDHAIVLGVGVTQIPRAGSCSLRSFQMFFQVVNCLTWTDLKQNTTLNLPGGSIHISWTYDQSNLFLGVETVAPGWVAVGTSDAGGMKGLDVTVFGLNGEPTLLDMYAENYGRPSKSKKQVSELIEYQIAGDNKRYIYKRPLASVDEQHRAFTFDKPQYFVYALGSGQSLTKHQNDKRGQQMVDLQGAYFESFVPPTESDQFEFKLVQSPMKIAPEKTSYCYSFFDLGESLGEKHHIVAEDMQIGSEFLHHSVGYVCDHPLEEFKEPGTVLCNYFRTGKPSEYHFKMGCTSRFHLGGKQRSYPKEMGKPLGTPSIRYILLENHFNNPSLLDDRVDTGSGFKLTLTKQLRPIDVGMLTVGVDIDDIVVPPGSLPSIDSTCGEKCTIKGVPKEGVTVFASQLHMHQRGYAMSTRHFRDGKELEPLPKMDFYDFDLQTYVYPSVNQSKIMPGDRLVTRCTYDTRNDDQPVHGGPASDEEMCFNFIEYYPAMPHIATCFSQPDTDKQYCPLFDMPTKSESDRYLTWIWWVLGTVALLAMVSTRKEKIRYQKV
ncbi:copper type II ascorbate-dependent monooxygenase [Gorgonomyces haynaldii]|nr:copper type II ascorbate-dependent monooxygenase [Gorgonomyces haynaldii]